MTKHPGAFINQWYPGTATSQNNVYFIKIYLLICEFKRMCLYLFSKAHTSINTSDLKISRISMVILNYYINVTTHWGAT